jgi:hypothetical protein
MSSVSKWNDDDDVLLSAEQRAAMVHGHKGEGVQLRERLVAYRRIVPIELQSVDELRTTIDRLRFCEARAAARVIEACEARLAQEEV